MKKELQELFDGLNKLCSETEAFYFSEQEYGENHIVRSFTYRLASHTDFLKPYARDCRGTAFVLDKRTGEWNLFCRAYKKFWNLGEIGHISVDNIDINLYDKLDFEECKNKLLKYGRKFETHQELINFLSKPSKM